MAEKMNGEMIYIYNPQQAYFYIEHKVRPLSVGVHKKTNAVYFVFDREKTRPLYTKWLEGSRIGRIQG